jgi:predicted MFS family arabinose efflux permease
MADPGASNSAQQNRAFIVIFLLLCALYACGHLQRNAGSVLAPVLNRDLGLDARELGVVMAGLFLAAGLTQIPFGIMLDRYGPRRACTALLLVGMLGSVLFALAEDWPQLMIGRLLIGSGFCGVFMSSVVIFAAWKPPSQMTTWTGRITAVGGSGGLLATTPLAGAIELVGWRFTLLSVAVLTAALTIAGYFFLRDRPPSVPQQQKQRESFGQGLAGVLRMAKDPRIRPMLLVSLFMFTPMQLTVGLWAGPYLLVVHGLDAIARGNVLLAMMVVHLVAALAFGPLERLFNTRKWIVVTGAVIQSVQFLLLAWLGQDSLTASLALLLGIAIVGPLYVMVTVHCQSSFPKEMTGRAVSVVTATSVFGVFLNQSGSSFIVQALAEPGSIGSPLAFQTVFGLLSLIFLFVALVYLKTRDTQARD